MPFIFLIFAAVGMITVASRQEFDSSRRRFIFACALGVLVLLPAIRDQSVGTDTANYVQFYESITDLESAMGMGLVDNEYGFWFLNWLAHLISDNYAALLGLIAFVVVLCYQSAIRRYSKDIGISTFVFVTAGFYTFFFNGARQGVACAICALALGPLIERKFRSYFCLVVLAVLFHKTAIVMLPIYFLIGKEISGRRLFVYILASTVVAAFLGAIVEFGASIDPRYADYATSGDGGGYLMVMFTMSLCAFFFYCRRYVHRYRDQYSVLLNLFIFGAIVSVISSVFRIAPSGILRLSVYFNVATVFLWPIVLVNIKGFDFRRYVLYGFYVTYTSFFLLSLSKFGDLLPFHFNSTLSLELF